MEPGGLWWTSALNAALPPQRHRPDTWPEHQDSVSHVAQKKREKEGEKGVGGERERREGGRKEGRKGGRKGGREGGKEGGKKERNLSFFFFFYLYT